MIGAREAALKALMQWEKSAAWSETVISSQMASGTLDARDGALAHKLCSGVLQNMYLCDHRISQFSSIKTSKMERSVLFILRIAVYELSFLDKIPVRATVNEAVNLAKKYSGTGASRFVNALLRRISEGDFDSANLPLSVKYSHPEWFVTEMSSRLGHHGCADLLKANNTEPPVYLQLNPLLSSSEKVEASLAEEGASFNRHPWLPDCWTLTGGSVDALSAFKTGAVTVQDPAAKLAVIAASPVSGQRIIDACAAPGGKSFMTAMMTGNSVNILSCDIHENKLTRIRAGAQRLGITCIETLAADASKSNPQDIASADLVIADVPCSGFGTIRKKPDIRYKDAESIKALPEIQKRILSNLSSYVRPGGTLLYSTCTIFSRENEDVVSSFLSENPDFHAEAFDLPGGISAPDGMLTLWPHIHDTDGFFICRLRRK